MINYYYVPGRGVKYCDERVCMSVSTFVCLLTYLTNDVSKLSEICCTCYLLPVAVAQSADDSALRYVHPVLWMTSCFPIMGNVLRG